MTVACPAAPAEIKAHADTMRRFAIGNPAAVLRTACDALHAGRAPVLAMVVETEGSTYASTGTLALFDAQSQVGWISGGCLEPEIARMAAIAATRRRVEWLDIDTSDDSALFSGAAVGCRGRQLLALVPLAALPGVDAAMTAWLDGGCDLRIALRADGRIACRLDGRIWSWTLPIGAQPASAAHDQILTLHRAPEVLLMGAGPETSTLVPLLQGLGWHVRVAERRARWRDATGRDTPLLDLHPEDAVATHPHADVALVMHHGFEADLEALVALAASRIPFIGLLGPERRRQDLFKLLRPADRDALEGRLQSPVGIPHCGRGPDAIALSIATQLQQWRSAQDAIAS